MTIAEIERAAAHGREIAEQLSSPQLAAYISYRGLYHDWHSGIINTDQAKAEKRQIIQNYLELSQAEQACDDQMKRWTSVEHLMVSIEKSKTDCPTCELARKIIRVLDGRDCIRENHGDGD